jgi:hypothetical protein
MKGRTVLFGDDTSGAVWQFNDWNDNGDLIERLFTAAFPLDGNSLRVDNLVVKANTGWTPIPAEELPVVEVRASNTAGATWGLWRTTDLGKTGNYRARVRLTRLGVFDFPGGMFEIRATNSVPFRISGVFINEVSGGKSR